MSTDLTCFVLIADAPPIPSSETPPYFDQVLAEIPRVREDLGFIPLVTPTSQIV
ncbi:TPA: hypothetical protein RPE40_004579, partial [Salmonella enterica]|nr:hypothetical protein [Salmonella enterica]